MKLNDAIRLYMGAQQSEVARLGGIVVWTEPQVPEVTSAPIVSGAAYEGDTAMATNGTWSNGPILEYEYRWQAESGGDFDDVPGQNGNTYADIPVGEFRVGVRARNAVGWSDWAYSAPFVVAEAGGSYVRWGTGSSNGEVYNDGKYFRHTGITGVANRRTNAPIAAGSKLYQEAVLVYGDPDGGALFGVIGDGIDPTDTVEFFYVGWETPRCAVIVNDEWSIGFYGNYGGELQVWDSGAYFLDGGTLPLQYPVGVAIDATDMNAVKVWIRLLGEDWYGGGNPETGTSPSIILPYCTQLYFGGGSGNSVSPCILRDPEEFTGSVPVGFTAGQVVLP